MLNRMPEQLNEIERDLAIAQRQIVRDRFMYRNDASIQQQLNENQATLDLRRQAVRQLRNTLYL